MQSPDMQRLNHILDYCREIEKTSREIIWETALHDIPALKEFCEKQLSDA